MSDPGDDMFDHDDYPAGFGIGHGDIVTRLRDADIGWSGDAACVSAEVAEEAAAEIERLTAENERLRAALEFYAKAPVPVLAPGYPFCDDGRIARNALNQQQTPQGK